MKKNAISIYVPISAVIVGSILFLICVILYFLNLTIPLIWVITVAMIIIAVITTILFALSPTQ